MLIFFGIQVDEEQSEIIKCLIHGVKQMEKYPESVRKFSLTLHYHSPRAYEFCRKTFNNHLPHAHTITSWYANSDLNTEPNTINNQVLNILKKKSEHKLSQTGEKLVVGLLFDEIHIMKHVQWSNSTHKLIGYANTDNITTDSSEQKLDVANQALVFIVNGVNESFQLPIAYYFIKSMNGDEKKRLVEEIIGHLIDSGIVVSNVTFDGAQANKTMCKLLGADLKIDSPTFKTYFEVKGQRVYIFFDSCHLIKLIRNRFATGNVLFDSEGNEIRWQYFIDLVNMKNNGYTMTHKMTRAHIEWWHKKMKVDLAVQTLSESTAASMEFLMHKNIQKFTGAEHTIKFIRVWDRLFDVFNSKKELNGNLFKSILSHKNAAEIFKFFDDAIEYIKGLKKTSPKGNKIKVCYSRINTGFNGFIIDMVSLKLLFQDFVEIHFFMIAIKSSCLQQDPVEIFFGKVRSLGGCNDNPTCEQFAAAFRKLLAYSAVMYSKHSNCLELENSAPNSNILCVTSRRPASEPVHDLQISERNYRTSL